MNITFSVLFLTTTIWYLSTLPRNYRNARKSGLPVYFCPVNPNSGVWLVLVALVGYSKMARILPRPLFDRVKLAIPGWEYRCRYSVNEQLGTTFILVSPGSNTVFVADPEIAHAVLTRRKDFGRIEIAAQIMAVFGPNLTSSDHEEWQRHRRIVAPILNERIMNVVWDESSTQAGDMLENFAEPSTTGQSTQTNETTEGLKTITINVIASVGFGAKRSWAGATGSKVPIGFKTTFTTSILTIVHNLFVAIFLSPKLLTLPFMPKSAQNIGIAKTEFPLHLQETIAQERRSPSSTSTLIGSLVRLADQDKSASEQSSKTSTYLTEEEITGNLFNFTIAGFDTSATTLAYSIMALALYPEWQDWIMAGIDEVAQLHHGADYTSSFPLLTRCLALMFETLRLYTPVSHIARKTNEAQSINDVNFAPQTLVQVGAALIHVSPTVWGADALAFRPSRWLEGGQSPSETLREPPRGTFLPWSTGPRFCPGIKMSQVEFVAAVRRIFSKWRVEVVQHGTETPEAARERLARLMADSSPKLTMQVNRPQDIGLRWVRR